MRKITKQVLSNNIQENHFYDLLLSGVTYSQIKDKEISKLWKEAEILFKKMEITRVSIEEKLPVPQAKEKE